TTSASAAPGRTPARPASRGPSSRPASTAARRPAPAPAAGAGTAGRCRSAASFARNAVAIHAAVQRLPAQAEFGGGLGDDAVVAGQRALDALAIGIDAGGGARRV